LKVFTTSRDVCVVQHRGTSCTTTLVVLNVQVILFAIFELKKFILCINHDECIHKHTCVCSSYMHLCMYTYSKHTCAVSFSYSCLCGVSAIRHLCYIAPQHYPLSLTDAKLYVYPKPRRTPGISSVTSWLCNMLGVNLESQSCTLGHVWTCKSDPEMYSDDPI